MDAIPGESLNETVPNGNIGQHPNPVAIRVVPRPIFYVQVLQQKELTDGIFTVLRSCLPDLKMHPDAVSPIAGGIRANDHLLYGTRLI